MTTSQDIFREMEREQGFEDELVRMGYSRKEAREKALRQQGFQQGFQGSPDTWYKPQMGTVGPGDARRGTARIMPRSFFRPPGSGWEPEESQPAAKPNKNMPIERDPWGNLIDDGTFNQRAQQEALEAEYRRELYSRLMPQRGLSPEQTEEAARATALQFGMRPPGATGLPGFEPEERTFTLPDGTEVKGIYTPRTGAIKMLTSPTQRPTVTATTKDAEGNTVRRQMTEEQFAEFQQAQAQAEPLDRETERQLLEYARLKANVEGGNMKWGPDIGLNPARDRGIQLRELEMILRQKGIDPETGRRMTASPSMGLTPPGVPSSPFDKGFQSVMGGSTNRAPVTSRYRIRLKQ